MSCMAFVVFLSITIQDRNYTFFQFMALAVIISGFFIVTIADIQLGEEEDKALDELGIEHDSQ